MIEFGEEVELRPGGCPRCGTTLITIYAERCWRCELTFPPTVDLGNNPSSTGGSDEFDTPQG